MAIIHRTPRWSHKKSEADAIEEIPPADSFARIPLTHQEAVTAAREYLPEIIAQLTRYGGNAVLRLWPTDDLTIVGPLIVKWLREKGYTCNDFRPGELLWVNA